MWYMSEKKVAGTYRLDELVHVLPVHVSADVSLLQKANIVQVSHCNGRSVDNQERSQASLRKNSGFGETYVGGMDVSGGECLELPQDGKPETPGFSPLAEKKDHTKQPAARQTKTTASCVKPPRAQGRSKRAGSWQRE